MKKLTAIVLSLALLATLAVPAMALEPSYVSAEISPYDNCQGTRYCPMWYFSDLAGGTWYHDGVHYCLEYQMIVGRTGPDDAEFDPNGSVTLDDLVRTFYRSAVVFGADVSVGEDTNILSYTDVFDIPQGSAEAFQWACGSGLVGDETTVLAPTAVLTRAELVRLLHDFAKLLGMDVSSGENNNILSYDDALEIPEDARAAFQWACAEGVIKGVSETSLAPLSDTTRSQLATVLMRLDILRQEQDAQDDGQRFDPFGAHFEGQWVNELSPRCVLQISGNGVGPFKVTIRWANTSYSFNQWEMTAVHKIDADGESHLMAQDCVRYDVTYVSETEFTYETVEVGAVQLDYSSTNGEETILWAYELDAAGECTFVRESNEIVNPIESIPETEGAN